MLSDITTGQQTVTATGPVTGVLDTSAMSGMQTIKLMIFSLTAGSTARIAIQDTANSSEFSDAQPAAVFDVKGPIAEPQASSSRSARTSCPACASAPRTTSCARTCCS